MTIKGHSVYIFSLVSIVVLVTIYLSVMGASYYVTSMEERFYHEDHQMLKPNGLFGHGLGIIGTLLILIGVFGYMIRKRWRKLSRIGVLKYWLEFHIFLCTLGPIMVLFHTAFKFGGIVSISFWSMVAVVASGVLGRFIYLQIPRTLQGRELSLAELNEIKSSLEVSLNQSEDEVSIKELVFDYFGQGNAESKKSFLSQMVFDIQQLRKLKARLVSEKLPQQKIKSLMKIIRQERSMNRKINGLVTMQKYFRYWHVAHLPFAIIMLLIMIVHVAVSITFGYTWIF
ncbi:MAG: hypothetical protein WAT79_02715 [Saprospiraceae bacterium]